MKIFVPGRICLFGEHSDWAGGYRRVNAHIEKGYCLLTGTNQGITAEVGGHPSKLIVTTRLPDGTIAGPYEVPMETAALRAEAEKGGFFSYVAGVAYQILVHYHVRGLQIDCTAMDLPMKKGLSSSAAISVLTARAFNRVYDLHLTTRGEMEYAYQGELITPSRCGRMDQACAFGQRPLLMTFDGDLLHVDEIPVRGPLYLFIVDLKAGKDTVEILSRLNHCYPFAESDPERNVHRLFGELNKQIVHEALDAIALGDAEAVGHLMTRAQELFDRYAAPVCPSQLTAPALHRVLAYGPVQNFVWGGKGVGLQGDGSAQFVARDEPSRERAIEIIERDLGMPCLRLDITPPARVRKAVIPVAGFGTRVFPASKAVKKELFPVVDRDGLAKPAIQLIVEEALAAGIQDVCLIVQEEDRHTFEAYFNERLPVHHYNKLSTRMRDSADRLLEIGRRIHFVVQDRAEGFGHAIFCARRWVGDEPFLLLLGDHLYRAGSDTPCARQLIDVYEKENLSAVGLMQTPEDQIGSFGTVGGSWVEDDGLLAISEFAEKPTADYARQRLAVAGVEPGHYLTVFGLYVIKPAVFDILEDHIVRNMRQGGEFQLTTALEELRKRDGFLGKVIDGRRFDIGTPEAYVQTVAQFAR